MRLLNYHERIRQLRAKCDAMLISGHYIPFFWPWASFGVFLVFAYLMVPHQRSPVMKSLRWPVWLANAVFAIYQIRFARAHDAALAYGVGFSAMWSLQLFAAIMLAYDCQIDLCRVERLDPAAPIASLQIGPQLSQNRFSTTDASEHREVTSRRPANDRVKHNVQAQWTWQPYPVDSWWRRLDWLVDLLTEFRGVAWNWRSAIFPRPPEHIVKQIRGTNNIGAPDLDPLRQPSALLQAHPQKAELLRKAALRFVEGYFILDALKTYTIHDPYFRGYVDEPAPYFLPHIITASPILTRSMRLLIGMYAIKTILFTIFALGPIFFVGVLGEDLLGVRGESWVYPDEWGSYRFVLDKGLEGWWGIWWHQTFRFVFEAPGRKLIAALGLEVKSLRGRTIQVSVAFVLSGLLHASGSMTALGDSDPIGGPFLFFCLQPLGIGLQMLLTNTIRLLRLPRLLRQVLNLLFVHFWFYHTASILVEDFAKAGTFLAEPYPYSPLRAIGLGLPGDKGFLWGESWFWWHKGRHLWESGIAF